MTTSPPKTSEEVLRMTALQLAINVHGGPNGFPDDIMPHARQFYQFLNQSDPCLDMGTLDQSNVVDLFEWAGADD